MSVNCGLAVFMTKQFLNGPDVVPLPADGGVSGEGVEMGVAVIEQDGGSKIQRRAGGLRWAGKAGGPSRFRRAASGLPHEGSSFGRAGREDTWQTTLDPARMSRNA